MVQLLSRQGGPGSYIAPVIILMSRQGGRFARNDENPDFLRSYHISCQQGVFTTVERVWSHHKDTRRLSQNEIVLPRSRKAIRLGGLTTGIHRSIKRRRALTCVKGLSTPFNHLNRFYNLAILLFCVSNPDDIANVNPGQIY